ncbi:MAG: co-chaperone GroES family protein [candidate division KSB1 bacterium]|nr:co-chaperone GroES family protein [candidate division KSB1 bacterium]MDZ7345228.1 co-chaperone GroES family protein [candidate division KSB1 bacterium]
MKKGNKELIVVGDRILIVPDVGEERSNTGLYLPKWALERESIQAGRIVEIGSGPALTPPDIIEDEPWKEPPPPPEPPPHQARVGDYALFLRKAAIEVKFEGDLYLIVPQAALLLLVRDIDDLE